MADKVSLDKVIKEKVKPMVDEAMHKFLGVTIREISGDISDSLKRSPLLDFEIDTSLPFRKAKDMFRRQYIVRLLRTHYGNISAVAKISGLDRRSIHRLIKGLNIDAERFRKHLQKPEYVRQEAVSSMIEHTLDEYRSVLNPKKLEEVYKQVPDLSRDIVKELPESPLTLKQAERRFEKNYISKALEENNGNVSKTARKIGLRYETLHRKLKELGV
ncbi:hypothetical protein GF351_02645 [Candidatus Woesearchaeota archaeon]|nr:hypothetical protein [Candidatus Woesearchaeota archaeon]